MINLIRQRQRLPSVSLDAKSDWTPLHGTDLARTVCERVARPTVTGACVDRLATAHRARRGRHDLARAPDTGGRGSVPPRCGWHDACRSPCLYRSNSPLRPAARVRDQRTRAHGIGHERACATATKQGPGQRCWSGPPAGARSKDRRGLPAPTASPAGPFSPPTGAGAAPRPPLRRMGTPPDPRSTAGAGRDATGRRLAVSILP